MADIQHYERIIRNEKKGGNIPLKILFIIIYAILASIWLVVAVRYAMNSAILVLSPLSVVIAVLLTWKYTNVEYEYSFVAGSFTLSKIYGKKKRKSVFEADLKMLVSALPCSSEKATVEDGDTIIYGVPSKYSEPCALCVFEDADEKQYYVVIDCDEMTLKILKFYKISAVDRELATQVSSNENI